MRSKLRVTIVRGLAIAGLATVAFAAPVLAQETPGTEYGQGAGVARARTLPNTGGGTDDLLLTVGVGAAAALGAAAGAMYLTRRTARLAR